MPESVLRTRHRCRASAVIGPSPREVRLSAAVSVPRRRRRSRRARRDALVFLAMALPNFVLIGAFTYRPLIMNIYYSTLNWTLGSASATIVGFGKYVRFFTSDAADGEHGEDRRGGQDDAGGIAGEEPHVVAETDDRGRGRAQGPVQRRVVDVHDQRAVREGADQDDVRKRHREDHERIATGAA